MSHITFASENLEARVSGPEMARMHLLCGDLLKASVGRLYDSKESPSWLRKYLPPDFYALGSVGAEFDQLARNWLGRYESYLLIAGERISCRALALNTAMAIGNDAIKFVARMNAQCELHCYVRGRNRAWLADIIARGYEARILRFGMGWEGAIHILRADSRDAVILSYSVTDPFPDMQMVYERDLWGENALGDEERRTEWEGLPRGRRWMLGLQALYESESGLELKPDGWDNYYFESGVTAFDLTPDLFAI